MGITHAKVSAKSDGPDSSVVLPSDWNAAHVVSGLGMVLLEQHSASNSASLDFTAFQSSAYDEYLIEILQLVNATDNVDLNCQFSTDGGANWIAGTGYYWHLLVGGNGLATLYNRTDSKIQLHYSSSVHISNITGYGFNGTLRLRMPQASSNFPMLTGQTHFLDTTETLLLDNLLSAVLTTANAVPNGLRFKFSSGNIASGAIRVYGIPK